MNSDFATNSVQSVDYWPNYQLDERTVRPKSRPVSALLPLQDKQQQPMGNNYPSAHQHQHHVGEQRHYPSVTMSVPNPQRKIQINNIINDDLFYSTSPYDYTSSTHSSEITPSMNDEHSLFEHNNFFDFSDDYGAQPVKPTSSPAIAAFSAAYDANSNSSSNNSLLQKNSLNDMMNQLELKDMMINRMELRSHSRLKLDGLDTSSHQQQLHYPSSLNPHYLSEPSALSLLTNSDRSPVKNSTGIVSLQDSFSLSEKSKIVGTIGRPYSTPVSTLNPSGSQTGGSSLNLFMQQPSKPNSLFFGGGGSSSHDLSSTFGGHLGPSSIALEKAGGSPSLKTRQTSSDPLQYNDQSGSRTLSWTELVFLDDDDDDHDNNSNSNNPTRPLKVYNSSTALGTLDNNSNNDYSLLHGGFNSNNNATATTHNAIISNNNHHHSNSISNGTGINNSSSDVPSSELGPYFQSFGGSASAPPLSYYKTDTSQQQQQQQQGRNISIDSAVSTQSSHSDKLFNNISGSLSSSSPSPSSSSSSLIQAGSMEEVVLRTCQEILSGASEHSLKAVELANTLRARGKVLLNIRHR